MFTTIWEYDVAAAQEPEFRRVYGSDGDWATLFRGAAGYVGTVLLADTAVRGRYVTLDRWESRAACDAFLAAAAAEYADLDRRTARLTLAERHLGTLED